MSSNRPFLSNFLAAFKAHSASLPKPSSQITPSSTAVVASAQALWSSGGYSTTSTPQQQQTYSISAPRATESRKSAPYQVNQSSTTGRVSPTYPLQHNVTPLTHAPRGPPSPTATAPNLAFRQPSTNYAASQETARNRRGSDTSSEGGMGFRDLTRTGEKWYIGGRTTGGEERFYKLSMVTRDRSADRQSADRMSL